MTANGGGDGIVFNGPTTMHGPAAFGTNATAFQPARPEASPARPRIRILWLAANPLGTPRLALDEEAREVGERLRLAGDRDVFELVTRWAVRPADLLQHCNEHRPRIVHFSGHGDPTGMITLSDGDGDRRPVPPAALAAMFRTMRDEVRVVVLNACYSDIQAQAISQHIDHVVGMRRPISDRSATIFAAAFYSALGFGRSILTAFEQGTTALLLHGQPDHEVPNLLTRPGADPRHHHHLTGPVDGPARVVIPGSARAPRRPASPAERGDRHVLEDQDAEQHADPTQREGIGQHLGRGRSGDGRQPAGGQDQPEGAPQHVVVELRLHGRVALDLRDDVGAAEDRGDDDGQLIGEDAEQQQRAGGAEQGHAHQRQGPEPAAEPRGAERRHATADAGRRHERAVAPVDR